MTTNYHFEQIFWPCLLFSKLAKSPRRNNKMRELWISCIIFFSESPSFTVSPWPPSVAPSSLYIVCKEAGSLALTNRKVFCEALQSLLLLSLLSALNIENFDCKLEIMVFMKITLYIASLHWLFYHV